MSVFDAHSSFENFSTPNKKSMEIKRCLRQPNSLLQRYYACSDWQANSCFAHFNDLYRKEPFSISKFEMSYGASCQRATFRRMRSFLPVSVQVFSLSISLYLPLLSAKSLSLSLSPFIICYIPLILSTIPLLSFALFIFLKISVAIIYIPQRFQRAMMCFVRCRSMRA